MSGRWRIRTADPLLVRQMLWTSWAKRPHFFIVQCFKKCDVRAPDYRATWRLLSKSECKGKHLFRRDQMFLRIFSHFLIKRLLTNAAIATNTAKRTVINSINQHEYFPEYNTKWINLFLKKVPISRNFFIFKTIRCYKIISFLFFLLLDLFLLKNW